MKNILKQVFTVMSILLIMSILTTVFVSIGLPLLEAFALVVFLEITMLFVQRYLPNNISLSSICGAISGNILYNCDFPMQGGTRDRAWIFNYADIEGYVIDINNPMLYKDIELLATKKGFYIDGRNNSIMPSFTMIKGNFIEQYDHIIAMKGFDISPETKQNLESMKSGRFVVVTENVFKGENGDSAFEVYGATTGLELSVLTRDPNNADTQGAFDFTFGTVKNKEPKMPATLFDTSYNNTLELLNDKL